MALSNFQTTSVALVIVLTSLVSMICGGWGKMSVSQEIQQAARGGVEELNLSNRGLTSLPPEIGQLSSLKKLRLECQTTFLPGMNSVIFCLL